MHAMGVSQPHVMIDVANRMRRRISGMVENRDLNALSDPAYANPAILCGLPDCALEAGPGPDLPASWREKREADAPAADALMV
jgi:hypothetical protein